MRTFTEKSVLIAEDDKKDAVLLQLALEQMDLQLKIHIVGNGLEVLDYLQGQGNYTNRARYQFPSVMFLDLKMPKMTGFQVLEWIKLHPNFRVVPTIIFSASGLQRDVCACYQLGANGYFLKPLTIQELARMMRGLFEFWSTCILPEKCYHPPLAA